MGFGLGIGTRIRKSPYFDATVAAGVTHFSTYNHTFMPVSYGDQESEYWRLVEGVSMWDVACQRQVELRGPDASALAQAVVCRDLSEAAVGQGKYTPMVDHWGRLMNDPLTLHVDEDRWWISLADSDMLYWCRAIAAERRLDVEVGEPDVSPLAVQGPKAEDVIAALFGDWIRDIRYFRYRPTEIEGIPAPTRSGRLVQTGRLRALSDGRFPRDRPVGSGGRGWPALRHRPWERRTTSSGIESALLSYRGDTLDDSDPFEARLGKFVDLDSGVDFIGREALCRHPGARSQARAGRTGHRRRRSGGTAASLVRQSPRFNGRDRPGGRLLTSSR